ncbi:class I SAM-dependent methyltransferase [Comamonadaceae bacterium PP-2]
MHAGSTGLPASPWVVRWAALARPGGDALDVACGSGRHARWLAQSGFGLHAVDRDAQAIASLQQALPGLPSSKLVCSDLEQAPWPFEGRHFDLVVVTHYLWRPLLPTLADSLAEDGVLIYETFTRDQAGIGKPSRPDFLLQPGELLAHAGRAGLRVVAYEDGFEAHPGRFIQRIAAVRESKAAQSGEPARRYLL